MRSTHTIQLNPPSTKRRRAFATLDEILDAAAGQRETIPIRQRREVLQNWRRVYAELLHDATGKWTWRGFEWHVFSYGYARALHGEKALLAYSQLNGPHCYFVCPQDERLPAFRIIGSSLPELAYAGWDIYIWPDGCAWTMAFTHEECYGPYFSRREWIKQD